MCEYKVVKKWMRNYKNYKGWSHKVCFL